MACNSKSHTLAVNYCLACSNHTCSIFFNDSPEVCDNYVWILRWVNLHCNWINLISILNFPKQWVGFDVWQGSEYYLSCFVMVLRGMHGNIDICQTDYSIHSKLRIFPYSEVIHGSITFRLTKD